MAHLILLGPLALGRFPGSLFLLHPVVGMGAICPESRCRRAIAQYLLPISGNLLGAQTACPECLQAELSQQEVDKL